MEKVVSFAEARARLPAVTNGFLEARRKMDAGESVGRRVPRYLIAYFAIRAKVRRNLIGGGSVGHTSFRCVGVFIRLTIPLKPKRYKLSEHSLSDCGGKSWRVESCGGGGGTSGRRRRLGGGRGRR